MVVYYCIILLILIDVYSHLFSLLNCSCVTVFSGGMKLGIMFKYISTGFINIEIDQVNIY